MQITSLGGNSPQAYFPDNITLQQRYAPIFPAQNSESPISLFLDADKILPKPSYVDLKCIYPLNIE